MSILIGFLYVVEVIVCLLLALAVMLQKPKEGGLGGAIGGGMGDHMINGYNIPIKAPTGPKRSISAAFGPDKPVVCTLIFHFVVIIRTTPVFTA